MMNANDARKELQSITKEMTAQAVVAFANQIEAEVKDSITSGRSASRDILVPAMITDATLEQIRNGYKKLGYRVRVDFKLGVFSDNLVRQPSRTLALFW